MLVSLKSKPHYLQSIPKRAVKVWLQFAAAVCLFLLMNMAIGNHYSLSTILLSFTAWQSVGNSNWYIFAILSLYLFTYLGGKLTKGDRILTILLISVCCVAYSVIIILCKKGSWWYDTILCYPAGMLVGEYEQQIKQFLEKNKPLFDFFCWLFCYFCCILYLCDDHARSDWVCCIRTAWGIFCIPGRACDYEDSNWKSDPWLARQTHIWSLYFAAASHDCAEGRGMEFLSLFWGKYGNYLLDGSCFQKYSFKSYEKM